MNFIISAEELNHALSIVRNGVSSRSVKAEMSGIHMIAGKDGLKLFATDGMISITGKVPGTVLNEGSAIIPLMFADVINKMRGNEITVTLSGNSVQIASAGGRGKKSVAKVSIVTGEPSIPDLETETSFVSKAAELAKNLSEIQYAIAKDESRQVLNGAYLEVDPFEIRLTSLDGFRLSSVPVCGTSEVKDKVKGIIPDKAVNLITKVLRAAEDTCDVKVGLNEKGIVVDTGEFMIRSGLIAGEYIDYRRIIPNTFKTEVKVTKEDLSGAISRVALFSKENKQTLVTLNFSAENRSLMISANAEIGRADEEIAAEYIGEPSDVSIAFNVAYLYDTIRAIESDELVFHMNGSIAPAIINDGQSAKTNLILPVRTFATESASA